MFCPNCGAEVAGDSSVCSRCGQQTAPPRGTQAGPSITDGKAIVSFLLGLASVFLLLTFLAGIPAVILGHVSRRSIRQSQGRLTGRGLALVGLVLGYLGILMFPVVLYTAPVVVPWFQSRTLKVKTASSEFAAGNTLRAINSAQSAYSGAHPDQHFAGDLATLGAASGLDRRIAGAQCTAGRWCLSDAYKFSMTGFCTLDGVCSDYVVVATPADPQSGARSFCSASDGIVRAQRGAPLPEPLSSVAECKAWSPL